MWQFSRKIERGLFLAPRRRRYVLLADEDLMPLIGSGDTGAFATLYDRHNRPAYSLAYRLMGERQAAGDLVQDAFLKVWQAAGSYRAQRGSARTWILSIVRNRGLDQLRSSASRRRIQDITQARAQTSQPSEEAFAEAWRNFQGVQVREALRGLPPKQLEVIELAYFSGYTRKEIAELLEVPLGTVKGRVRMGLKKMREYHGSQGMALAGSTSDP
jgi:RNA polymerase sigma-70 factor, ECF subfamily